MPLSKADESEAFLIELCVIGMAEDEENVQWTLLEKVRAGTQAK